MAVADLARTRVRVPMVWSPRAFVLEAPTVPLRAQPRDDSERVDEAHYAELLRIIGEEGDWYWVQGEADHYFGWLRRSQVGVFGGHDGLSVTCALLTPVHAGPEPDAEVITHVPAGMRLAPPPAWLKRTFDERGWTETPAPDLKGWRRLNAGVTGYIAPDDVVAVDDLPRRYPTAEDLIATAEPFIGTPYLWGGTTALGIDCSGLVQQVYRLNGVGLDRDADQQALEGRAVDAPRAGDLVFFGKDRVTHVGLAVSDTEMIHAPQGVGFVERALIHGDRTILAIRRYLADIYDATGEG